MMNTDFFIKLFFDVTLDANGCKVYTLKPITTSPLAAPVPEYDYEPVTITDDGGTTCEKGWSVIDNTTNPPTIVLYKADNTLATGFEIAKDKQTIDYEALPTICKQNAAGKWSIISYFEPENPTNIVGPLFINPNGVISPDPGDLVDCEEDTEIVDRTTVHERTSGNNTYAAPFRRFSLTAIGTDVTLNGQALEKGMTVNLDTVENEQHITDQIVTGSDYFVTYVI